MKEIGGYFGLEQFTGKAYYDDLIPMNSGRNALLYILKARQVKKLYIPRFLCDSVSGVCKREGYAFEEYSISESFLPKFSKELKDGEYLYVVNYYGQISNSQISLLKEQFDRIIIDNVQAFFQKPVSGIDTVYSCRKFFGVPDGGYVSTDAVLAEELERDVSKDRMTHILGRFEGTASEFYSSFQDNDLSFAQRPMRHISELTHNLLRGIDYEHVRTKRNENYAVLAHALGEANKLQLITPDGPYCYPFYSKDGMRIKKVLAAKKIYVPTLWPNVLDLEDSLEKDFAENILPLPYDQRYDAEDMEMIIKQLR